jgi:hypothetical protein
MAGSADLQAGERDKMADFNTTSGTFWSALYLFFLSVPTDIHSINKLQNVSQNLFQKRVLHHNLLPVSRPLSPKLYVFRWGLSLKGQ